MQMKLKKLLTYFTPFEWCLWAFGVATSLVAFFVAGQGVLNLICSLIGVTSLIFVAKGNAIGKLLCMAFAVLYAVIAYRVKYWSEFITYLGMNLPVEVIGFISWIRHPFKNGEVKVGQMTGKRWAITFVLTFAVTTAFFFVLRALDTKSLPVATLSVFTSFLASSLLIQRSRYFALAFIANDLVLIILWTFEAVVDQTAWCTVACFSSFLANDIYSFINWYRMEKRQLKQEETTNEPR